MKHRPGPLILKLLLLSREDHGIRPTGLHDGW